MQIDSPEPFVDQLEVWEKDKGSEREQRNNFAQDDQLPTVKSGVWAPGILHKTDMEVMQSEKDVGATGQGNTDKSW